MKSANLACAMAALSLAAAAMPACAASPKNTNGVVYDVISLGNPLGGTYGQGSSITNRGQVAGFDADAGLQTLQAHRVIHLRSPMLLQRLQQNALIVFVLR